MAAGLPSWRSLVARLESDLIPADRVDAFNHLNRDDLERRTDMVLFLTGDTEVNASNSKYLKRALYDDAFRPEPAMVAQAIAQLISVHPRRVSVLTTNYDVVLETAFEEVLGSTESYTSSQWNEWIQLDDASHRRSVMHLHGTIFPDDRASCGPLILSESDFRKHGRAIQERLCELMKGADVLVLGASLADRNIAAPLALTRSRAGKRFVAVTPILSDPNLKSEECANVAVWHAEVLRKALDARPILLKSHAQVAQLTTECALAAHSPRKYSRPRSGLKTIDSLHYGTRFRTVLESAYESLGASRKDGSMSDLDALALSNWMNELTFRRNGPAARLAQLRKRYKGKCAEDENIGIFVWLRDLPRREGSDFALRLMVSSAYAHWKSWSAFRLEPITSTSRNAAVQAAFSGRAVFLDVPKATHSGSWQGAWAQPLVAGYGATDVDVGGLPLDQLQLGAVAVNTDCVVTSEGPSADAKSLSALALLGQDEMAYFRESVDLVIEQLFGD